MVSEDEEELPAPRFRAAGFNRFVAAAAQPFSTFAIDVDTASFTLARHYMANGLLPPAEALTEEKVQAYFEDNEREMTLKLREYMGRNRDTVPRYDGLEDQANISKAKVLQIDGDVARTEISYSHGWLRGHSGHRITATVIFHLQWTDGELVFVGHEKASS